MNIIPTIYIYPSKEKVCISEKLKIYLDNPKSDLEIEIVKLWIKEAIEMEYKRYDNLKISKMIEKFKETKYQDSVVQTFFEDTSTDNVLEQFSKMWIIVRYDDEGSVKELLDVINESKTEDDRFTIIDQLDYFNLKYDHPLYKNSSRSVDYCYLLSLLINEQNYLGHSFTVKTCNINPLIIESKNFFSRVLYLFENTQYIEIHTQWDVYPSISESIQECARILERAFEDEQTLKRLMFVGNILKTVDSQTEDQRLKFLSLISIIEMLLTHNPDNNRFNVEDSINKQFQLKTSIIIYLCDKTQDIKSIKEKLKAFYSLRSSIAHGSFDAADKVLKKIYELYKKEIDSIDAKGEHDMYYDIMIEDLYIIIRMIITIYLEDKAFVEFLKEG